MKKVIFASAAIIAVMAITLGLYAQPAGGGGFGGGGMGGFGGGGMGGFGGGGGGMMGGRGNRGPVERPDKAQRLKDVAELEKQVTALKAAIEKAPEKDPNIAALEGSKLTDFMNVYTPEEAIVNSMQNTLTTMSGRGARGGMRGGVTTEQLTELRTLANDEKATKVVARIDELIKEAQTATTRRGGGRNGGGAGGGFGGGRGGAGGGGMMGGGRGGRGGAGGGGA